MAQAVFGLCAALFYIPESPKFLIMQGNLLRGGAILQDLSKRNNKDSQFEF
jgi:hypothetical protein